MQRKLIATPMTLSQFWKFLQMPSRAGSQVQQQPSAFHDLHLRIYLDEAGFRLVSAGYILYTF